MSNAKAQMSNEIQISKNENLSILSFDALVKSQETWKTSCWTWFSI